MVPEPETDHERIAHELQVKIIRAMTPAQRLARAQSLQRMMRQLLAAGYRDRHPEWTEAEVNQAVADRILHARTG